MATEKSEHRIQNEARLALSENQLALTFRCNVGQAWTGSKTERLPCGSLLIRDPRPFKSGLPKGVSDLIGISPMVIQPHHVGQTIGRFVALEAKSAKGKPTKDQENFIKAINKKGGAAGIFRSADQACSLVRASQQ